MKCSYCGESFNKDDRYCPYCGTPTGYGQKKTNTGAKKRTPQKRKKKPSAARTIVPIAAFCVLAAAVFASVFFFIIKPNQSGNTVIAPNERETQAPLILPASTQAAQASAPDPDGSAIQIVRGEMYEIVAKDAAMNINGGYDIDDEIAAYNVLNNAIAAGEETVRLDGVSISDADIGQILDAYGSQIGGTRDTASDELVIRLQYSAGMRALKASRNSAAATADDSALLSAAEALMNGNITPSMSAWDKERVAYEQLCARYAAGAGSSAKEALLDGRADARGVSDAFVLLCGLNGIEARSVRAKRIDDGTEYTFCVVKIKDVWYAVDVALGADRQGELRYAGLNLPIDVLREIYDWNEYTLPAGAYAIDFDDANYYVRTNRSCASAQEAADKASAQNGAATLLCTFGTDAQGIAAQTGLTCTETALNGRLAVLATFTK